MRFLLLLSFSCFLSITTYAQLEPVQWSTDIEKTGKNEYQLVFTANIEDGWSIYSQYIEEGGPVPTKIEYRDETGMEFLGKAVELGRKEEAFDDAFGIKIVKFKNRAKIKQKIKLKKGTENVQGSITYMTCNENGCLPPRDVKFYVQL